MLSVGKSLNTGRQAVDNRHLLSGFSTMCESPGFPQVAPLPPRRVSPNPQSIAAALHHISNTKHNTEFITQETNIACSFHRQKNEDHSQKYFLRVMAQVSQEQLIFINLELESWNYFHLKTKPWALAYSHSGSVQYNFSFSLARRKPGCHLEANYPPGPSLLININLEANLNAWLFTDCFFFQLQAWVFLPFLYHSKWGTDFCFLMLIFKKPKVIDSVVNGNSNIIV